MRTIVVAYGMRDRAIGVEGELPWKGLMPADMRHFSEVTRSKSLIMGRKTLESLPGGLPLEGRQNIVLSMSEQAIKNVHIVHSLEEAYKTAYYEPMVIGGGQIYELALPTVNKVIATEIIVNTPNADTKFPKLLQDEWELTDKEFKLNDDKNKYAYAFMTYLRRNPIEE